jgi:hypothetical protein
MLCISKTRNQSNGMLTKQNRQNLNDFKPLKRGGHEVEPNNVKNRYVIFNVV